jgi:WD repeat-containing protein 23
MSTGTCTVHSWNDSATEDEGDPPMGLSYNHKLECSREFNQFRDNANRRRRGARSRGGQYREDEASIFSHAAFGDW